MIGKNHIKTLLITITFFITNTVQAIVIRHDKDDLEYQQLAKQYKNSITYNDGCVGTVIDSIWVLTAAHCVSKNEQRPFFIEHLEASYPVEFITVHPKHNADTNDYDMALLRVKWPIKEAKIALLYPFSDEVGQQVIFVGNGDFGNGIKGITSTQSILRAAQNTITKTSQSQISFVFNNPESALELEGISGPHDSGGPAFIEKQEKLYIAGVSSWQSNKGKEGVYGVGEHYARVSTLRNWIENTIQKHKPTSKIQHPLLSSIQTKSFDRLAEQLSLHSDWKQNSELIRELLIELTYNLTTEEANKVISIIPELATLKLNNISLPTYAIEQRNWALFNKLIEFKIDINEQNIYGESYLIHLLMLFPLELPLQPLLEKLLENGLDINARDERGNTALAVAVYLANRDNNNERVNLLLRNGANPDIGDLENFTPMMYIADVGNIELAALLIKNGVRLDSKDITGKTALDFAKKKQHISLIQLINTKIKQ